jgi:hypothetical protein
MRYTRRRSADFELLESRALDGLFNNQGKAISHKEEKIWGKGVTLA